MGKSTRANSKKSAPLTQPLPPLEDPLFQVDLVGNSITRRSLHSSSHPDSFSSHLRRGSTRKPLTSDLILSQAIRNTATPALPSRFDPAVATARKAKVDRKTKEKLKAIVGRNRTGDGLWGVKSLVQGDLTEAVKRAGEYDVWTKEDQVLPAAKVDQNDEGMSKFLSSVTLTVPNAKPPQTLHKHALLSPSLTPSAIPLPHPGQSYNPSHSDHQSLLKKAHDHYTIVEEREQRGTEVKEALDRARSLVKRKEAWEVYEEEVGDGEDEDQVDPTEEPTTPIKAKLSKRKTQSQRNRRDRHALSLLALSRRRALSARTHSVVTAPSLNSSLSTATTLSLSQKVLLAKLRKQRLRTSGLAHFRSGPSKVPTAPISYQTGDELAEGLRTLKPEGNLWRDWLGSGMKRGKIGVERGYENNFRGGKLGGGGRKGSGTKIKDKRTYKFGAQF